MTSPLLPPHFIPPPSNSNAYLEEQVNTPILPPYSSSSAKVTAEYRLNGYSSSSVMPISFGFLLGVLFPISFYFALRFKIIDLTQTYGHLSEGLSTLNGGETFLYLLLTVVGFATIWLIVFILFIAGLARSHGDAGHIFGTILYVLGLFIYILSAFVDITYF